MPSSIPSITNGQRINPFVAPTDFIMLISSLRLNIVILMVFEMINRETSISRMIMPKLIYVTDERILINTVATSLSSLMDSTLSSF